MTLNLTVTLHGTTQTCCSVVPKATDNASQPSTMSLVVSSVPARLFGTKVAQNPQPDSPSPFREKTRLDTQKPKHSIENTPALKIVQISTTPWPCSWQPPPSSQITNSFKIHYFRPILPSSFCISLRPSRRAVLTRRNPMSKHRFLPQHVRQTPQAGCTRYHMQP